MAEIIDIQRKCPELKVGVVQIKVVGCLGGSIKQEIVDVRCMFIENGEWEIQVVYVYLLQRR